MAHELLVEPYPEVGSLSMFNVLYPRFAYSKATAEPITPAPTIMAAAVLFISPLLVYSELNQ